jgi:prepilin-type N-terminal cleavage/methylation domain-containing protein
MATSGRAIQATIKKRAGGFTLLEMLLVVALIAILASIVILAINPGKQLAEARNAQRRSDVNTILNAVYQYSIDNNGTLPSGIPVGTEELICKEGVPLCGVLVDLTVLTTDQKYLTAIPQDPNGVCNASSDCYSIYQSSNGRVTVLAPYAELGATISVTR